MRTKTGVITSNKMQKTLVVRVERYKTHPKYHKHYRMSSKFYAHCENEKEFKIGDTVTISETRPLSKTKRWIVVPNVK